MNRPRVQPEHIRREQIMTAAFAVIAQEGLTNTTMAKIAKQADLSTGIVSHYFGDKQGLIDACMRELLNVLLRKTEDYKAEAQAEPQSQIRAIIDSNFDASQTTSQAMRVWLEFWSASMHMPELHRLQRVNDQRLYSNLHHHFLQLLSKEQADVAARGMAALIDGLWLRGCLSSQQEEFDRELARSIAYDYLEMQINLHSRLQEEQNE
ncbi:transcriptional regulator BetI [Acinetobacter brisouii]|uniref:transcriptional regulator BetI n=1 Tax=Acinetobacter brisouii TaxID=396323 RepID=UPI00124C9EDF|nr:transcriptional regulator BetI [Acinetobacter brisouii]